VSDSQAKRQNIIDGRKSIIEAINRMDGLHAYPSDGNFVLIDASALGKPSSEIVNAMIARGIFIRPMSGHHMAQGYVRVTIGTPEQNRRFIHAFAAYIQEIL
jgi:histidinol-phosphate aminotransferase